MTLRPEPVRSTSTPSASTEGSRRLAERGDPATLALAWVISNPAVTAAVVGPRRPEHLEPALAARDLDLSPGERDEIASFFD